jgi:hypothetical protein
MKMAWSLEVKPPCGRFPQVFESMMLRAFGPKRDEVTGGYR